MPIVERSQRLYETDEFGNESGYTVAAVFLCSCGCYFDIDDLFATACPGCGVEVNGCGQTLAPRSQWGEETGETFH